MNGLDSRRPGEHVKFAPSEASVSKKTNKGGATTAALQPASERTGSGSTDSGEGSKDGVNTDTMEEKNEGEGEECCIVLEQPLLTIKEVFVYRVPPLRASSGHRAEEWGLENPVFTGEEVLRTDYRFLQAWFSLCTMSIVASAVKSWEGTAYTVTLFGPYSTASLLQLCQSLGQSNVRVTAFLYT